MRVVINMNGNKFALEDGTRRTHEAIIFQFMNVEIA